MFFNWTCFNNNQNKALQMITKEIYMPYLQYYTKLSL